MKHSIPFFSLLLLMAGCAHSGSVERFERTSAATHPESRQVDVYLIPLEGFDFRYAAQLAKSLEQELGIRITPTVNMGMSGLRPFPGTRQYSAEEILEAANRVIPNLPSKHPDTAFIVLTHYDLNTKERALRFNFAVHNKLARTSVVSSARLLFGRNGIADQETIQTRIRKMVKRSIGDVYYGYERSTDINDLMYAPIMSLDDVDRIGNDFMATKRAR